MFSDQFIIRHRLLDLFSGFSEIVSEISYYFLLDGENEDILLQIQEEQRQFPQRFARRLHQVGKGFLTSLDLHFELLSFFSFHFLYIF